MATAKPLFRKPRSNTPQGLASFGKAQTKRIRDELTFVAGAYGDVDQGICDDVDRMLEALNELDKAFDLAVLEGRGADR